MDKECKMCKTSKSLSEFFSQTQGASANAGGTSSNCKECHNAGLVPNGYFGKFKSPQEVEDFLQSL